MLGSSLLRLHTGQGRRVRFAKSANFSPARVLGACTAVEGSDGTLVQEGWWLILSLLPELVQPVVLGGGGEHLSPRQAEMIPLTVRPGVCKECRIWDEGELGGGFPSPGGQTCLW